MKRLVLTCLIVLLFFSVSMASSVRVVWPGNADKDGVVKYTIYMKANNTDGSGFVKGQDIAGTTTGTTYIVDNVLDSPSYCVRTTATDNEGNESAFSAPSYIVVDTTPPVKVGIPTLKYVKPKLTITWPGNASSDGVTKYRIYLQSDNTDGSGFVKGQNVIGTVKGNVLSYVYNIRYSSTYCVRITAVDAKGNESEFSNPAFTTVP
jgi:hypothetical protein